MRWKCLPWHRWLYAANGSAAFPHCQSTAPGDLVPSSTIFLDRNPPMVRVRCPQCSTIFEVGEGQGGAVIACPQCGKQMRLAATPQPPPATAIAPVVKPPAAPAPDAIRPASASPPPVQAEALPVLEAASPEPIPKFRPYPYLA